MLSPTIPMASTMHSSALVSTKTNKNSSSWFLKLSRVKLLLFTRKVSGTED